MIVSATLDHQLAAAEVSGQFNLHDSVPEDDQPLATEAQSLNHFLAGVERKAYRMAQMALRHEADALDAVQDAMMQLSLRYADRPAGEWRPLFYRILENRIRDVQRRRAVRARFMSVFSWQRDNDGQEPVDLVAEAPDTAPDVVEQLDGASAMTALETAVQQLPARQRQAFLLRSLENLDVAQTAAAMKCSEGSVKTHYFRALQALRGKLGEFR